MAVRAHVPAAVASKVVLWQDVTRRRASDAVRLLLGVLGLAAIVFVAQARDAVGPLGPFPDDPVSKGLDAVGALGAGAIGVVLVLLAHRGPAGRFLRDLLLVMVLAGALAAVAIDALPDTALTGRPVALAMVLAAAAAGRPYGRRAARLVLLLASLLVVVVGFLAGHVPLGVVAIVVLAAWSGSAGVHLVLGSPRPPYTADDVRAGAAALGVDLDHLGFARVQPWGVTALVGRDRDERGVAVLVYGRDAADAQFLSRLWRLVWYRQSSAVLTSSRLQQAEHAAYALLMAERNGVAVPSLLVAGQPPDGEDAMVIHRLPDGRLLDAVDADDVSDATLDHLWANLDRLHRAGLCHGTISPLTISVEPDGHTMFVDVTSARATTDERSRAIDVAQLLVTAALATDAARATQAVLRVRGADVLEATLPLLQPSAMSPALRQMIGKRKLLGELRAAGAAAAGVEEPELVQLHRVSVTDVAMLAASAFGIHLIVTQIGSAEGLGEALKTADWAWGVVCLLLGMLSLLGGALCFTGAISVPLPFRPVVILQFANQFTGLVGGTVLLTATNIRFAQRRGLPGALAVSAGVLVSLAGFSVQLLTIFVAWQAFADQVDVAEASRGSLPSWVLPAAIATIIVVALVVGIPRFRRLVIDKVRPSATAMLSDVRALLHQPRKLARLLGGAAFQQVLLAASLSAALLAFGVHEPLVLLLALSTLAAFVGGIAPVPGGLGVIEGTLIAGLTAVGVNPTIASASVLTFRAMTAYFPPIWGWGCLVWLRKHDYL